MILWDVNLWVYAFRADSPFHQIARQDVDTASSTGAPFIINSGIITSFLRLVTNPRIFNTPSPVNEAWEFVDALASRRGACETGIDAMTMGIFKHITLVNQSKGNDLHDDLLAALAIRHDATLHTIDAGFRKYQGLHLKILAPQD